MPTLRSILTDIIGQLNETITIIPVRRGHVLSDVLTTVRRASFCCSNPTQV
jgi:hypothetical protein